MGVQVGREGPVAAVVGYGPRWRQNHLGTGPITCSGTLALSPHLCTRNLSERKSQVGSLAGAAHLLKANTGVQRGAQWEQKSHVEHKGKSSFDFDFQY